MRIKKNNFRMKSEVAQLDYVSPWKTPPQSARNALEILLTKSKILEEVSFVKQICKDGEIFERSKTSSPKKTCRTVKKDNKDQTRKSYLQNYYSKSQPLRKDNYIKKIKGDQHIIFVKKHQNYHKPKLITVGNQCSQQMPSNKRIDEISLFWRERDHQSTHLNPYLSYGKKKFMVKKQRLSYNNSRQDLTNHKDFVESLQSCLINMEKTLYQKQSTQKLTTTLKNIIGKYKNI